MIRATASRAWDGLVERRWPILIGVVVVLALTTVGLAGWNVTLVQSNNRQDERLAAADALRASEARAAKLRKQGECRSSIKGTTQVTTIIEDLRSTYLELASNAVNPDFVAALKKRAKHLPMFPAPKCDPGPPSKKKPKKSGSP